MGVIRKGSETQLQVNNSYRVTGETVFSPSLMPAVRKPRRTVFFLRISRLVINVLEHFFFAICPHAVVEGC